MDWLENLCLHGSPVTAICSLWSKSSYMVTREFNREAKYLLQAGALREKKMQHLVDVRTLHPWRPSLRSKRDDSSFDGGDGCQDREKWTDFRLFLKLLFRCDDALYMIFSCFVQ